MLAAALIIAMVFVGLTGVRVIAARRAAMRRGQVYAGVLALAAALVAIRGSLAIAAGLGFAALLAWAWDQQPASASPKPAPNPVDEADLRLLGLGPSPSREQIRSAFRAKMAQAHPDRGGDSTLAARIVAARDRLLKKL